MASTETHSIIITVHGIRTFGQWQDRLKKLIRDKDPGIAVENYGYGYFTLPAFCIPFARWLIIRTFKRKLVLLFKRYGDINVSFVGHSFGTYIIAKALQSLKEDEWPRVQNVILCGSVLKSNFDWDSIFDRGRLERVVNDCGINDWVLRISQALVLFTGMAGKVGFQGFSNDRLMNRYFKGGHSHYFEGADDSDTFMRRWWLPTLLNNEPPEPYDARVTRGVVQGFDYALMQIADPIKLGVYGGILYSIFHWGIELPRERLRLQQAYRSAAHASEMLTSGQRQGALKEALAVLRSSGNSVPDSYNVVYNALLNASSKPRSIDVGNYNLSIVSKRLKTGEILTLSDDGNFSTWTVEGANTFKLSDTDLGGDQIFAQDGSSLFVAGDLEDIIRVDLTTRVVTKFSTFLLDADLKPTNALVASDEDNLIGCRDKVIVAYATGTDDGENVLKVRWQSPIKAKGDCQGIQFYDDHSVVIATDKGEIQIFDYNTKKFRTEFAVTVDGLEGGIGGLTVASDRLGVSGAIDGYTAVIFPAKLQQAVKSVGFQPQFRKDGRFLASGWEGDLRSNERVHIYDLSKSPLSNIAINCICEFVGFLGQDEFLTLDHNRQLLRRSLADGSVVSTLMTFDADVRHVAYLEDVVIGYRQADSALFARLDKLVDNSVSVANFSNSEFMADAFWIANDVACFRVLGGRDGTMLKLARSNDKGVSIFWSQKEDSESAPGDEWRPLITKVQADRGGRAVPPGDVSLPGEAYDANISGNSAAAARQVGSELLIVKATDGHVLFRVPHTGSQIRSFWISKDGTVLAAGAQNGTITLWRREFGESPVLTISAHASEVRYLDANPAETFLLSTEAVGRAKVWPLLSRSALIELASKSTPNGLQQ